MKICNVDVVKLKEQFGTPLYIYDKEHLKRNIMLYLNNFKSKEFDTEVLFASKAFCVKEMVRLINSCNMSLDVVSIGELYTALSVGFPMEKVYFHGNNKLSVICVTTES